jgi:hypothetical protein
MYLGISPSKFNQWRKDGKIPVDRDTGTTALYRHFNAAGDLLYVGISLSVINRLAGHMASSKWASDIATVKIEYFDREAKIQRRSQLESCGCER